MKIIDNELIKILNNRGYIVSITLYCIVIMVMLFVGIVLEGKEDLSSVLTTFKSFGGLLVLIFSNAFIISVCTNNEFKNRGFKFELITGLSRLEKFKSSIVVSFIHSAILTALLLFFLITYFLIVNLSLGHFNADVVQFFVKYLVVGAVCSTFVNFLIYYTKSAIAAIFITIATLALEIIITNNILFTIDGIEKITPYLFFGALNTLYKMDFFSLEIGEVVEAFAVVLVHFSVIQFLVYTRMQRLQVSW